MQNTSSNTFAIQLTHIYCTTPFQLDPLWGHPKRSRSVRGGYLNVHRACSMFLCILGRRIPLDALCVLANGGLHVLEGCSSVL
eukprot:4205421-Pyramimonas_sp.AAC.1